MQSSSARPEVQRAPVVATNAIENTANNAATPAERRIDNLENGDVVILEL
jgi:hypothetical protein